MERAAKLTIILGATGTGKTTLLKQIIKGINQRAVIVTPDDIEWQEYPKTELLKPADFNFQDVRRFVFDFKDKHDFENKMKRLDCFTNGVMVFDDCRMYFDAKEYVNIILRPFLGRKRQKMVDYFAVGHGFNEVPPMFFTFATDLFLFNTTDNVVRRRNCLKDYDGALAAQQRITAKCAKNPHYFEHIKFV
jgi:hypothetical protein